MSFSVSSEGRRKRANMKQRQQKRGPAPLASSEDTTVDHSTEQSQDQESTVSIHHQRHYPTGVPVMSQHPKICVDGVVSSGSKTFDSGNIRDSQVLPGLPSANNFDNLERERSRFDKKVKRNSISSIGSDLILPISGRSSRLSSICSNRSGSRSVSPHFTQLETSFCGSKPAHTSSDHLHPNLSPICISPLTCLSFNTIGFQEPSSALSSTKDSSDAASIVISSSSKSINLFKLRDVPNKEAALADTLSSTKTVSSDELHIENFADFSNFDEKSAFHTNSSHDTNITENDSPSTILLNKNKDKSESIRQLSKTTQNFHNSKLPVIYNSGTYSHRQCEPSLATSDQDRGQIHDISSQLVKKVLSSALTNTIIDDTLNTNQETSQASAKSFNKTCRSPSSSSERQSIESDSNSANPSAEKNNKNNDLVNSTAILEATKLFSEDDDGELCYVPTTLPQEFPLQNRMIPISERKRSTTNEQSLQRHALKTNLPSHSLNEFNKIFPEDDNNKVKIILPNKKLCSLNSEKIKHTENTSLPNGQQQKHGSNVRVGERLAHSKTNIEQNESVMSACDDSAKLKQNDTMYNSRPTTSEIVDKSNVNCQIDHTSRKKNTTRHGTNAMEFLSDASTNALNSKKQQTIHLKSSDAHRSQHPVVPRSPVEEEEFAARQQLIRERASSNASIVHEQTNRMVEIMQDAAVAYLEQARRNSAKKNSLGSELHINGGRSRSRSPSHSLDKSRSPSPHKLQMETSFCGSGKSSTSDTIPVEDLINLSHAYGDISPDFQGNTSDNAVSRSSSVRKHKSSSKNQDFPSSQKESELSRESPWKKGAKAGTELLHSTLTSSPNRG